MSDENGYGRPPKDHQFKPGQSGNPSGRPKKLRSLKADLKAALSREITITNNGVAEIVSMQDAIVRQLVNSSAKNVARSQRLLFRLINTLKLDEDDPFDIDNMFDFNI